MDPFFATIPPGTSEYLLAQANVFIACRPLKIHCHSLIWVVIGMLQLVLR